MIVTRQDRTGANKTRYKYPLLSFLLEKLWCTFKSVLRFITHTHTRYSGHFFNDPRILDSSACMQLHSNNIIFSAQILIFGSTIGAILYIRRFSRNFSEYLQHSRAQHSPVSFLPGPWFKSEFPRQSQSFFFFSSE
jgi:hypothetical protein